MWSGLYSLDSYDYESACGANNDCFKISDQRANFAKKMQNAKYRFFFIAAAFWQMQSKYRALNTE